MQQTTQPKTVVITGTSSGFGSLTAKSLTALGHMVVATMRDASARNQAKTDELESFARSAGYKLDVVGLDATCDDSVSVAIGLNSAKHARIDVLVNNAGVMNIGVTVAYSMADLQSQFEVNPLGPARMFRAVLPGMRANGAGLIVSVTSLACRVVFSFFGAYAASKFALEVLAEAYRYELTGTPRPGRVEGCACQLADYMPPLAILLPPATFSA